MPEVHTDFMADWAAVESFIQHGVGGLGPAMSFLISLVRPRLLSPGPSES